MFLGLWQGIAGFFALPVVHHVLLYAYIVLSYAALLYANTKLERKLEWFLIVLAPITIPIGIMMVVAGLLMARIVLTLQDLYSRIVALALFGLSQILFVIPSMPGTLLFGRRDAEIPITHTLQYVVLAVFIVTTLLVRYAGKTGRKVALNIALLINIFAGAGLFLILMAQTTASLMAVAFALVTMLAGSVAEDMYSGKPVVAKPAFLRKKETTGI